ncbi:MAG: AMP-binding protein, partial [bacterium]|nr:AMP-binding protein [bacterium]
PLPLYPSTPLYRTADLARGLADGSILFEGRIDNQVKIRGFRIEPGEIENQLLQYEGIKKTLVTLHTDKTGEKSLCAYIIPHSPHSPHSTQLQEFLAQSLPQYMIPAHFITIKKFPLNSNGKVDLKSLPAPTRNEKPIHTPPQSPIEKILANLWSSVLNTSPGIDDNFFDLGGHSLKATILISKIQKELHVNIPLVELFKTPTIRGLAAYIQHAEPYRFRTIPPAEKKEYYPLTPAQKRLYVLQESTPHSTAYNLPLFFKTKGTLDLQKFKTALITIIKRHSALRTSFHMIDNEPVQKITPDIQFQIETDETNFIRPFDLSQPPLFRVQIREGIIAFDMHHIVTDGTSLGILVEELVQMYREDSSLPQPLQYIDYSTWYRSGENEENRQEKFWLRHFQGDLPILDLPLDFPRPPVQDYDGKKLSFTIGALQTTRLKQLSQQQETTLYLTLSAIFSLFLSKLTGAEDIITGTPTAGRRHAQLSDVVGMFVNTLAIRHYPTGTKTFINYLRETKQITLRAFDNQEYPFDRLVSRLIPRRDISRNPLFDVMFELQNTEIPTLEIPGLKLTPYFHEQVESKFDMTWSAAEAKDTLIFTIIYRGTLFKEATLQRFIVYFNQLLTRLSAAPDQQLSQYSILPETEKRQILEKFNRPIDTSTIPRKTIHQLFEEQVVKTPAHIAAVHAVTLTYRELNTRARQLANALIHKGVRPGTIVALMTEPSLEMVIGILGILKAGGAFLPISPQTPPGRVTYMREDSRAVLMLTQNDISSPGQEMPLSSVPATPEVKPDDLVYVIYTSGTSGQPKGVMVEHRNLINYVSWFIEKTPFRSGDRAVLSSSFAFDLGYSSIFPPLLTGGRLHLISSELYQSPEDFLHYIYCHQITYLKMTPSLFGTLIRAAAISSLLLESVRFIVLGGEVINIEDIRQFSQLSNALIIDEYGPTEATIGTIAQPIIDSIPSIGTPIANTNILILDKHMHLQPIGIPGELYISGSSITRGYMNSPSLTIKSFVGVQGAIFQK